MRWLFRDVVDRLEHGLPLVNGSVDKRHERPAVLYREQRLERRHEALSTGDVAERLAGAYLSRAGVTDDYHALTVSERGRTGDVVFAEQSTYVPVAAPSESMTGRAVLLVEQGAAVQRKRIAREGVLQLRDVLNLVNGDVAAPPTG